MDLLNLEKWAYRAGIAVLSVSLWWANYTIDRLETEAQEKERAAQAARMKSEEEFNERLAKATNDLVIQLRDANATAADRGADLERLRSANARLQARIKSTAAPGTDSKALSRCSELLSEGAELVTEGEGLLLRHSAEHDALTGITVK